MILFDKWCWTMAWRDCRAYRKRLILFLACISLGVAALVALRSFGTSVKDGIIEQSRSLLGGDLLLKSRQKLDEGFINEIRQYSSEDVKEWRFASMSHFEKSTKPPRLVQVRGIEKGFPIYGQIETEPPNAAEKLFDGSRSALVDESLGLQYEVKQGDKVRVGENEFIVAGFIKSLPGESIIVSEISPRILIPFEEIEGTKLITFGSRVSYRQYFKYKEGVDEKKLIPRLKDADIEFNISYETVKDRQEAIDKTLENLFYFLNMVAFVAFMLGGIGIGSAIRVHISSKLKSAAVLRCLGASRKQAVGVFIIQSLAMGLAGGIAGSVLGSILQIFLPQFLNTLLPLKVETSFSLEAFVLGAASGVVITVLFSINPLMKMNSMTAKDSLSSELNTDVSSKWSWLVYLMMAALVMVFSVSSATKLQVGVSIGVAMLVGLLFLLFSAWLLMKLVREFIPDMLPFIWRQGLQNLYRPKNQTLTLILSLGTGTFLIAFLYLIKDNMLYQVRQIDEGSNPNIVLFDIQTDQVKGVEKLLAEKGLKSQVSAMVSMRLTSINGVKIKEVIKENKTRPKEERRSQRLLQRTYRSTYRDKILSGESIIEGEYINKVSDTERIPISVAKRLCDEIKLKLNDEMTWDIGGIELKCYIASIRKVEWMQMRPNFFVVFPAGVLEEAPQMLISFTRTADTATSVSLQNKIGEDYPNISVLDLSLIVNTVKNMLDKVSLAVSVMAAFSIVIGLVILMSSLHLSQLQRVKDNTLLKVLGASKKQIVRILFSEFCFLALLAANAGTFLAYLGNWAMSVLAFENSMPINWSVWIYANVILLFLTIIIGLMISLKTYKKTSLEVLRTEV